MKPKQILRFWFKEISPKQWWLKDDSFDKLVKDKFFDIHQKAIRSELYIWRKNAKGRLAEIIILDQFSRNIYRNSPLSFANDSLALALAQESVSLRMDKKLKAIYRNFLYLPFMHSESLVIHQVALKLYQDFYQEGGSLANLDFEIKHKAIIERFNRYPHRNEILGRKSTQPEIEFLKQPHSSF